MPTCLFMLLLCRPAWVFSVHPLVLGDPGPVLHGQKTEGWKGNTGAAYPHHAMPDRPRADVKNCPCIAVGPFCFILTDPSNISNAYCLLMKKMLIVLFVVLTALRPPVHTRIKVPYDTATVMIDGKFDAAEWNGAHRLPLTDSLELYLKQDRENIYWCLRALHQPAVLGGVNVYLSRGNHLVNLHASAKLGERTLTDGSYGGWQWWNNQAWTANVARLEKPEERRFLRDEAKEFQLRKTRFSDKTMRLMLDIEFPRQLLPAYPAEASATQPDQWLWLQL
jgi:hypothetical protein